MLKKLVLPKGMKLYYQNEIIPVTWTSNRGRPLEWQDHNPLHYFRVFLNFGYFLQYLPFRLKRVNKTKFYMVKSTSLHKVTCFIFHILSGIRFMMSIRKILNSHKEAHVSSPVLYFEICRTIFTAVYMSVFKWTFWTKSKLFCSIANELTTMQFPAANNAVSVPYCNKRIKVTTLATLTCILYSIIPICNVILGSEVINIKHLKFNQLVESYAGMARYTFLIQKTTDPFPISKFDLPTYLLIPVYVVMNFYYFLGGHFFDLSVLMGALTLRHLARAFADTVIGHPDPYYINMIMKEYSNLKELSAKINSAISGVAFCFVVEALPYYATHFDDILTLDDWYDRLRYIFYVVNFITILVVASDIIVKVDSLKIWISKENNCLTLPTNRSVVLVSELTSFPVGLKPGGILTITYGFIGTMVSVVVTYAVIILQFNFASSHSCRPTPIPWEAASTPASVVT